MPDEIKTATIDNRGHELQVHVAPWRGLGTEPTPHLHIQDLAGGAGEIVPVDSPRAQAFARAHPEVRDLGIDTGEEQSEVHPLDRLDNYNIATPRGAA